MQIIVNGSPLTFDDALGPTHKAIQSFEGSGDVQLRFSIAEKRPHYAGFITKVGGKAVGKPTFLDLDEDPEVPRWLLNRIFGEIEIADLPDGHVTADWGAIFENSAPYQAIREWAQKKTREELHSAYQPSHELKRKDEAQAMRYRDQIAAYVPAKAIDVLLLGGRRERMDTRYDTPDRAYQTYSGLISQVRYELKWLLRDE